jgi:hypothetical protein
MQHSPLLRADPRCQNHGQNALRLAQEEGVDNGESSSVLCSITSVLQHSTFMSATPGHKSHLEGTAGLDQQ